MASGHVSRSRPAPGGPLITRFAVLLKIAVTRLDACMNPMIALSITLAGPVAMGPPRWIAVSIESAVRWPISARYGADRHNRTVRLARRVRRSSRWYYKTRRAGSEGTAAVKSGRCQLRRPNALSTDALTCSSCEARTSASTEPPKPPPTIRAPAAPAAMAASTAASASDQETSKSSRREACELVSRGPRSASLP